jgi:hypothetical protein
MAYQLEAFADVGLDSELLECLLTEHERAVAPMLGRLWAYYRNPMRGCAGVEGREGGWYRLAQEEGLPSRLRTTRGATWLDDRARFEQPVIENDIGWRIDALVSFVFGKPVRLRSEAREPALRNRIEAALGAVLGASGGMALFQDMALLGSVHGWVDLVLRTEGLLGDAGGEEARPPSATGDSGGADERARIEAAAARLRVEVVEAPRSVPLLGADDYRRVEALMVRSEVEGCEVDRGPVSRRVLGVLARRGGTPAARRRRHEVLEVLSAQHRQVYVDGDLVEDGANPLGTLPVVHVQNASQPFQYAGLSDVEPLIPIQDELNTRLSDRAHRVTMQSFNMYLAKGVEGLGDRGRVTVGPGEVWVTDNPDAQVEAFGGDGQSPSEERHVEELREAMDKISGVSPVVLGVVRAKLGHLSSVNALRITMLGILAKTERKRLAYGRGIAAMSRLILRALDMAGVLRTDEEDRAVRFEWPDPLPVSEQDAIRTALLKRDLGVPTQELLEELGYAPEDDGVVPGQ